MSEQDWTKLAIETGVALVSGAAGVIGGIWRAGRASVHRENAVKEDYRSKIGALEDDMRKALATHEATSAARVDGLVEQFKESFIGMRRQMDDDKLYTEREFMRKDDFRDFREEYREDMRDLKKSIADIKKA